MHPSTALTDWFPAEIKPVHIGWYVIEWEFQEHESDLELRYWDGKQWCYDDANTLKSPCLFQRSRWRGLRKRLE